MIFDFYNEQDTERQGFTGKKTTFWEGSTNLQWMGKKAMEQATGGAKAAAMTGSILFPSEDVPREQDPGRILPRKEDFNRFTDTYIEPAIKYWTPSPDEVGHAAKILGNVAGMALAGGPGNITLNATMNTGANLIDQGVDPTTATLAGIGTGAASYALTGLPQTGKTLLEKAGLVALNPVIGVTQDTALKKGLERQGYKQQAAGIDPFDPVSRGTDVLIGSLFGGLAHFAKVKERLPVEVVDAVDAIHNQDKINAASPFKEPTSPVAVDVNNKAYNKALDDLHNGQPVDVSSVVREYVASSDIPYKTEPHPGETRLREIVEKETAALAADLAAEYPTGERVRIMPPHQDIAAWSMTRDELFSARDNTRDWYDNLEHSILGDQVKEWRQAVRRGDTRITDRIESRLKPEEVDDLYGIGTKYAPDDFARLADARDTVRAGLELNGYTEKNLAGEIASALYKVGDKKEPSHMAPSELEAYVKLDEAFKIIQEHGMDSKTVSDEAAKLAMGHFPDPEDALFMLNRFTNKDQQPAPTGPPASEIPQTESIAIHPEEPAGATRALDAEERQTAALTQTTETPPAAIHEAHDSLASNVETLLREHGDVALVRHDADGQQITVSGRQVLEEARADIERTRQLEKAYQRAALCLGFD